ncbi:MAG: undecaprenyl/decaprenyl-phosphate alpha-N-acetylglucosaminyl 1-phosphate transferase [Chloroflexi bacterium]|nr:undecaprenyl/decaprenyl-phosphate alpha-N-acetylglucosaminyl 1-phosphate transferase [Chloroflexota bacterium]
MASFLIVFAVALVLATAVTPVAERLAPILGWVDAPSARKVHLRPVPLLGGVAIYLATIAALLVFGDHSEVAQLAGIGVGATLVSLCGLWDDRRPLSPVIKLAVQALAALVTFSSGIGITILPHPALNFAVTMLWMIGITNAFNLLDNMDGLSGGVGAISALFFLVLALQSRQVLVGTLSAALLGACIGFLMYNFNPARIFMGDSGSLFLGFILAAVGIKLRFPGDPTTVSWMIPLLVLGVPLFDTTLVTLSRLRRRLNPLATPGKDHLSHRLVAHAMSAREAVLTIYVVCFLFGVAATLIPQAGVGEAYVIFAVVAILALASLLVLERDFMRAAHSAGSQ